MVDMQRLEIEQLKSEIKRLEALSKTSESNHSISKEAMSAMQSELQSLRDALAAATTDGDVIVFDSALSGQTISLSEGQLEITAGITITGLGSANLTVDAVSNSRVFYISTATSGVEV
jgi:hypothetical protein